MDAETPSIAVLLAKLCCQVPTGRNVKQLELTAMSTKNKTFRRVRSILGRPDIPDLGTQRKECKSSSRQTALIFGNLSGNACKLVFRKSLINCGVDEENVWLKSILYFANLFLPFLERMQLRNNDT